MSVQHNYMRNANALSILEYLRTNGMCTRREIQSGTGLSWAAVSTITSELLAQDILVEKEPTERASGRTPTLLDFNSRKNMSIGAEINAEGLTVVLLDIRGNVLDAKEEILEQAEKNATLNQMTRMTEEMLRRNNLQKTQLLGIGVSVQGSVDKQGAISLYNHYIKGWQDVPLKDLFEDYFGVPVRVMHDPFCIALAEEWEKEYLRNDDFVLIRLGYGIGMSYMHDGRPLQGHEGTAGELGHMVVDVDGEICTCGNQGCLEAYCSIRGIARRIYEATVPEAARVDKPFYDNDITYLKNLLNRAADMANRGNKIMQKIFDDAGRYMGVGVANLINLLNPRYVILTGEILDASDRMLKRTKEYAKKNAWHISSFEIIVSKESRRRASMGAALHFINEAFESQESILLRRL